MQSTILGESINKLPRKTTLLRGCGIDY